ncbi:hypothetical protein HY357_04100 [Candidatus Roizmanbacteria bacterium]|nr:hypothetical protein [Candidatus Roizmanbacteria bacterium]
MAKKILTYLVLFLILTINYELLTTHIQAIELESPRFRLELEKLDININKGKTKTYSLASIFGREASNEFLKNGAVAITASSKSISVLISESLIDLAKNQELSLKLEGHSDQDSTLSLIQEYLLKNSSGETIDIKYSLVGKDLRSLPNQNKGDFPTMILNKTRKKTYSEAEIIFRLDSSTPKKTGTYETTVNFIATSGY